MTEPGIGVDIAIIRGSIVNVGRPPGPALAALDRIEAQLSAAEAERDMLEANTIGIEAHDRIVESLRAETASLEATERDVEWFHAENARLKVDVDVLLSRLKAEHG